MRVVSMETVSGARGILMRGCFRATFFKVMPKVVVSDKLYVQTRDLIEMHNMHASYQWLLFVFF